MTYPWALNDRFNAAFPNMRGMTLNTPPPLPSPIVNPTEPYRMQGNPAEYEAWRRGNPLPSPVDQPMPSMVPPAQVKPPVFPTGGAASVPYSPAPVVQAGAGGVTLNNTPPAPGWAGTVGMPASPEATAAFQAGKGWEQGLTDIAKGIKGKENKSTDMNTIAPMSAGVHAGGEGGAQAANLLGQLLAARRRNYGMTLTG